MLFAVGDRVEASSASVWAISEEGSLEWTYDTGSNAFGILISGPYLYIVGTAADNGDGNGTRNIWKLDKQGNYIAGAYFNNSLSLIPLVTDGWGTFYTGGTASASGNIVEFDADLNVRSIFGSASVFPHVIFLSQDGKYLYVDNVIGSFPFSSTTLKKIKRVDYSTVWEQSYSDLLPYAIVELSDGTIVVGFYTSSSYKEIKAIPPETAVPIIWEYEADSTVLDFTLDLDDNIYCGTEKGLISLDSSGAERWNIDYQMGFYSFAKNSNDDIFVGSTNVSTHTIWKINKSNGSLTGVYNTGGVYIQRVRGLASDSQPPPAPPSADGRNFMTTKKRLVVFASNKAYYET